MKRLTVFSLSFFVIAVIFTVIGGIIISDSNVNFGDVFTKLEKAVPSVHSNVNFQKTPEFDLSNYHNVREIDYTSYQLNEFNTLSVYAEKCTLQLVPITTDNLVVSLITPDEAEDDVTIQSVIKDGNLYVKFVWCGDPAASVEDTVLSLGIPENYKGGFDISANESTVELCDMDSSMDIRLNLHNCLTSAHKISGREITFEASGGNSSIEKIVSNGGFTVTGVSTQINISYIDAFYTKAEANSSELNWKEIRGSLSADTAVSNADFNFKEVTGNISVKASAGSINVSIPKLSPVSLRHEERFSRFKDNITWDGGNKKNNNSVYIIDTNMEFGIVTLTEKE